MYQQSEKDLLNGNISSICPHNILKFGLLMAKIWWRVWGTPANFNGFHGSVTAWHSSSEHQPNCGVEQRAPPIFGRAAITLALAHILVAFLLQR